MPNQNERSRRRIKEADPRVISGPQTEDGDDVVRRVLEEPEYLKRADEVLRRAVSKNLRLVLP
jgi:hypothetical protein